MIKLEEFDKLQQLLKGLPPVVSRIDRNVDKIYKDIEGEHGMDGTKPQYNLINPATSRD